VTATPVIPSVPFARARRLFRTPKGLLILCLAAILVVAAAAMGVKVVAPGVLVAVVVAMLVDAPILRLREGAWTFPDGAVLTGVIIAMILSPQEPWHVVAITTGIGIVSKYVLRSRSANIFNPAALALVATFYLFDTGQSWWGALGEVPWPALIVLFATGLFITDRVKKMPAVLAFLGAYFMLAGIAAFAGGASKVAELYRVPDVNMALYFAFFMVSDPPTAPVKARDQMVFGGIVAVVGFGVFEVLGAAYFLLAGLLVGNGWEAMRRRAAWRDRRERRGVEASGEG
jgi:Na+-translocating ferredoxin:NAD+ oxidoreductase RnfD subunit